MTIKPDCQRASRPPRSRHTGFTLIELMIAVAILAIVMAIAIPAYQDQMRKSRRVDAQAALLELTQFMERVYTGCNSYALTPPACTVAMQTSALPFQQAPKDGATKFYDLTLSAVTTTTYTLSAAPISGSAQASDYCGTMTIPNAGAKTPTTGCWR